MPEIDVQRHFIIIQFDWTSKNPHKTEALCQQFMSNDLILNKNLMFVIYVQWHFYNEDV